MFTLLMEPTDEPSQRQMIETLLLVIEEQRAIIEAQRKEIATLPARVAELERQAGLNSSNSGKPPPGDGLKRPPRTGSLRKKTGKKSGGQKGHKGETLAQTGTPDRLINHYPETCCNCGGVPDQTASLGYRPRQVPGVPEPQLVQVTEHRAHICGCPDCGTQTQSAFPADVTAPVQYGARITALAVYLRDYHMIPEDRLAVLLKDVCGIETPAATIAAMEHRKAEERAPVVETIAGMVKEAPVKHMDETGYRVAA